MGTDSRYDQRGVSASKEDVHNAIKNIDKGLYPKAFCKIVPDILTGNEDYCTIMHADGAGTKSSLAYMYWKETGTLASPLRSCRCTVVHQCTSGKWGSSVRHRCPQPLFLDKADLFYTYQKKQYKQQFTSLFARTNRQKHKISKRCNSR